MANAAVPTDVLPPLDGLCVAVDTETSGLHPDDGARLSVMSVAWLDTNDEIQAYAFPFEQGSVGKPGHVASLFDDIDQELNLPQAEWEYLLAWLQRQRLVWHNAKFDIPIIRAGVRGWAGIDLLDQTVWDCMVIQKEITPTLSLELKQCGERYALSGGRERDHEQALKAWLKRHHKPSGRYDLVPWDLLGPYAAMDAYLTLALYLHQQRLIDEGMCRWSRVHHRMRIMKTLAKIERRGVGYDAGSSLAEADRVAKMQAEIEKDLPFRATLPAAKTYFFGSDGPSASGGVCKVYRWTEKGSPVLDEEVVRKMVRDEVPWAQEWQQWQKLDNARSMWYQGYPEKIGPDGRLRTVFRQTKVRSGRVSSERLNLQAIPKEDKTIEGLSSVRSFLQAKPGYRLWNLDLSQAELRVASKYANCVRMLKMLEEGADFHSITTQQVMDKDPADPKFKFFRDVGKRLTFSGIFQVGPETFQFTLSKEGIYMPLSQCTNIVYGWRDLYPEYGYEYQSSQRAVEYNGYVLLCPGTELECLSWFGPRDWANTAWSRRVQGSLAEFVMLWLCESEQMLQDSGDPEIQDSLVLTVHDSLVLELPDDERGPEWSARLADHGSRRASALFDIEMPVDRGPWHSQDPKIIKQYDTVSGVRSSGQR